MKIAYIGYDLSCLRVNHFFHSKNDQVTFFLVKPDLNQITSSFDETKIFVNHVMMSNDSYQQTEIQKKIFQNIKKNFHEFQSLLSTNENQVERNLTAEATDMVAPQNIQPIERIIDIHFNSKTKKNAIELENHGVEEFDFVLSEQNDLISLELEKKNIFLFDKELKTDLIWTTFSYQLQYLDKIKPFVQTRSFFLVLDSDRDSLVDNWLHCSLEGDVLKISSFQPYNQLMNPEFQRFTSDRMRQQVLEKLEIISIKAQVDVTFSTVSCEYLKSHCKMKSHFPVPNFLFWSEDQMNTFLDKNIYKRMSKINLKNSKSNSEVST